MEIYYVRCKNCGFEIEIDRKPVQENLATAFSATWTQRLTCGDCGDEYDYERADVKTR